MTVRHWIIVLALCVPQWAALAADDPFSGDWKLDQPKAKTPVKGPQTQFLHIEADEAHLNILHKGIDAAGAPAQWWIKADFNGALAGVFHSPDMDAVTCLRSDPHTILLKLSRDAVTIGWRTIEVSKNGRTLKVTTALESGGKQSKTVETFGKQ